MKIILASSSPRRRELLSILHAEFEVISADADETLPPNIQPQQAVEYLAALKRDAVAAAYPDALVIGADTVVCVEGEILGKPRDRADAARMLRLLAGRQHMVYTGVALRSPHGKDVFHQATGVRFYPLDEAAIAWYLDTGESFDKAGAYGIQEKGALLVEGIEGDYFNVMGLPLARTARRIQALLETASAEF